MERHENFINRHGIWYIRQQVRGKDRWKSTKQRDWKAAKRVGMKMLGEDPDRSSPLCFAKWWERYEAVYQPRKAASTRLTQASHVAHFLKEFGETPIDEIPKSDCVAYLNARGEKVRQTSIRAEQSTLQAVFQAAVEEGLIKRNPWRGIKKPDGGVRDRVLSLEEQEKLLSVLSPSDGRWVRFMLGTGLRLGDRIESVSGGILTVLGKGSKRREVPLLRGVKDLLPLPYRHRREWQYLLEKAAQKAEIPHVTPHTLRHTFATRFLEAGGDIYVLSKILGHASVTLTEKVYAHPEKELFDGSLHLDLGVAESVAGGEIIQFPA